MTLIERLEAATEGSRELDGDIALYVDAVPAIYTRRGADDAGARGMFFAEGEWLQRYWEAPRYTTSLDAALTLVPEGCDWRVKAANVGGPMEYYSGQINGEKPSYAPTPALALCIAALKARTP